ncbi:MAG: hypothetical protein SFY96_13395 [Planctomycetota bacterium]|nr:hypothetical protein [Planctomycetota bacterium]
MAWFIAPARVLVATCGILLTTLLGACSDPSMPQDSPEATIKTASKLIQDNKAKLLPRLIDADSPDMRRLLDRFGVLLGNVQTLAAEAQRAFPDEVKKLRESAEQSAKAAANNPKAQSGLASLFGGMGGGQGGNRRGPDKEREKAAQDLVNRLFTDPYAWLRDNADRLSTTPLSEDAVGLLWDGKPIIPGIGLTMTRRDGKWYFAVPQNIPLVSAYLPHDANGYKVWGSLIVIVDNMVKELIADLRAGRVRTLDELSRKAGEKAFIPMAIGFYAVSRLNEPEKPAKP